MLKEYFPGRDSEKRSAEEKESFLSEMVISIKLLNWYVSLQVLLVDNKTGKPLPFGTLGIHKVKHRAVYTLVRIQPLTAINKVVISLVLGVPLPVEAIKNNATWGQKCHLL